MTDDQFRAEIDRLVTRVRFDQLVAQIEENDAFTGLVVSITPAAVTGTPRSSTAAGVLLTPYTSTGRGANPGQ